MKSNYYFLIFFLIIVIAGLLSLYTVSNSEAEFLAKDWATKEGYEFAGASCGPGLSSFNYKDCTVAAITKNKQTEFIYLTCSKKSCSRIDKMDFME